jgi:hypothetical protein
MPLELECRSWQNWIGMSTPIEPIGEPESVEGLILYMDALTEFSEAERRRSKMRQFGSPEEILEASARSGRAHAALKSAWEALTPAQRSQFATPPECGD